ncbi:MAG: UDP-N-acetylglucosamine--dolichyl-phosphate N-acetylglucosaminephosphotransferase [Thaumarchaeota archaeon]|nr:UDP-N-acetylglucosamine--dolichyl-phosphate N-acetylglucosaminephosphotransferase [Nitrososphaerota archaeon]
MEGCRAISTQVNAIDPVFGTGATAVAVIASYYVAKFQSNKFTSMGISGIDIHKRDKPVRAEMGGLAILFGLAVGSTVYFVANLTLDGAGVLFASGFSTIAFTGLVGVADDIIEIRQRYKPFLIVAASTPLMYYLLDRGSIFIPEFGTVHLGLLYPLVAVPLAITTSANFSNLLAGFNGMEAGCAAISIGTMAFLSQITGHPTIAILGYILSFAYVGFLGLNWYPAKIFPGDTGTLMSGAAVAAMGLAAGLEFEAIVLSIPAAIDFTLKIVSRTPFKQRRLYGNTSVNEDGTLNPPGYPALVHAFMRVSPIRERGLVISVLAMQAVYAIIAIAVVIVIVLR